MSDPLRTALAYLESDAALEALRADVYWPKWNAPWWHMTLLHEMGFESRIPARIVRAMTERLAGLPPDDARPIDTHCPCSLGNIYQTLAASGVDVDEALPWARPWFLRLQVEDGGLTCDEAAYRHAPTPSSMVGTLPPLEAILHWTPRPLTEAETRFLDRGARCLLGRRLSRATADPRNAEEKEDEADWLKPCFPRFYLYDVLRGLSFVLAWADRLGREIPRAAIADVVAHLEAIAPDGRVRIERHAYEGIGTRPRGEPASFFPLLERVSRIGDPSPGLTAEWAEARERLEKLTQQGLIR